jgi:hypothetical protein
MAPIITCTCLGVEVDHLSVLQARPKDLLHPACRELGGLAILPSIFPDREALRQLNLLTASYSESEDKITRPVVYFSPSSLLFSLICDLYRTTGQDFSSSNVPRPILRII